MLTLAVRMPSAPSHGVTAAHAVEVGEVNVGERDGAGIGEIADEEAVLLEDRGDADHRPSFVAAMGDERRLIRPYRRGRRRG